MNKRALTRGLAAGAFAAALIGSLGVTSANAAEDSSSSDNCVVNLDTGAAACGDEAALKSVQAAALPLVRFWDGFNYTGSSLTLTGSHRCSTPLDAEYFKKNLGQIGWNNRASSLTAYNNCAVKLYDGYNFGRPASGWLLNYSNLGSIGWNNRASSVKIS